MPYRWLWWWAGTVGPAPRRQQQDRSSLTLISLSGMSYVSNEMPHCRLICAVLVTLLHLDSWGRACPTHVTIRSCAIAVVLRAGA